MEYHAGDAAIPHSLEVILGVTSGAQEKMAQWRQRKREYAGQTREVYLTSYLT